MMIMLVMAIWITSAWGATETWTQEVGAATPEDAPGITVRANSLSEVIKVSWDGPTHSDDEGSSASASFVTSSSPSLVRAPEGVQRQEAFGREDRNPFETGVRVDSDFSPYSSYFSSSSEGRDDVTATTSPHFDFGVDPVSCEDILNVFSIDGEGLADKYFSGEGWGEVDVSSLGEPLLSKLNSLEGLSRCQEEVLRSLMARSNVLWGELIDGALALCSDGEIFSAVGLAILKIAAALGLARKEKALFMHNDRAARIRALSGVVGISRSVQRILQLLELGE